MRVGLVQLNGSDDPADNLAQLCGYLRKARAEGVEFVLTPEVSNLISTDRARQMQLLRREEDDPTLAALGSLAAELDIWLLIGSLALRSETPEPAPFVNRSMLIDPAGQTAARYDKIHMFDVDIGPGERYAESAAFRPGRAAVLVETGFGPLGMTVCYDLRFPGLYRDLARAGAVMLSVPAAFSPVTGAAHWEVLLRARAIETGCFVLAPAQTGAHAAQSGRSRETYGHSMVVGPWGDVLFDAGTEPGVYLCDLDLQQVADARHRIPSLAHGRSYDAPT